MNFGHEDKMFKSDEQRGLERDPDPDPSPEETATVLMASLIADISTGDIDLCYVGIDSDVRRHPYKDEWVTHGKTLTVEYAETHE